MRVEEREETRGQVKTAVRATRALVTNDSLSRLALVGQGDGLATFGTAVPLCNVEGYDKVSVADESSTSTLVTGLSVVVTPLGTVETFFKGNVARHPFGHLVVLAVQVNLVTASRGEHGQRHNSRQY